MAIRVLSPQRITQGKTLPVIIVENEVAGTYKYVMGVECDAILSSLWVSTVNSGTLDISVRTYAGSYSSHDSAPILSFPTISAPTTELLIEKGAVTMDYVEFTVTHDGTVSYELSAKGIGTGEVTVQISSIGSATAETTIVGTSPQVLLASSLSGRSGLILKNWTESSVLYVGYSLIQATAATGYPLVFGESMGMDLAAGVTLYGVGTIPIDVRILESGN